MATEAIYTKSLGGAEDLLLDASNSATVIQTRAGKELEITKINSSTIPYSGKFGDPAMVSIKDQLDTNLVSSAYVIDTIEDLITVHVKFNTVIVKDINRGGIFVSKTGVDIDPNTGSLYTVNGGTVFAKLGDGFWVRQYSGAINVKWFGAKGDGITDNTSVYDGIINSLPEGTTIEWTPETYAGDFISNKAFVLNGNGATLIPTNFFAIKFEGSLGSYNILSSAPVHNDIALSGVTGLTRDAYVLLYSGNKRPSDNSPVNYEVVKIRSDGTVYDKVYSDQNGGAPKYAIITPIDGVKVDGFTIEAGTSNFYGVYVKYATNVQVTNIKMNGGSATTVTCTSCLNVTVHHIQRIKPSATGSGQGYNVALDRVKYGKAYSIYGEETRHDYDQDSSYVMDISKVISIDCISAAIAVAHNSFCGYTTVKDCSISKCNSYAISASGQGWANPANGLFRELVVDNIKISNTKARNVYDFYVGVFMDLPTENIAISNITIENISDTNFDYPNATYNTGYFTIRLYDPRENTKIYNINVDISTSVVQIDRITNQNANIDINLINVNRFANIIGISSIASINIGRVTVSNITYYSSVSMYGNAVINIYEGTNNLNQLMLNGLQSINQFTKSIKLPNNTVGCPNGKIDTAGFRVLSSMNSLTEGGTITQFEFLTYGEFGVWGSTSKTLSNTVPIERPVTTGDRFSILNYGNGTLTIPGNSKTVSNTSNLLIEPGFLYGFQVDSSGNKWRLARKISGITLS